MKLVITEYNAWENEKWNYFIDTSKQTAQSLNLLMSFIRLANKQFEIDKKEAPNRVFASSNYFMEFYDSLEIDKDKKIIGVKGKMKCIYNGSPRYKTGFIDMNKVISERKILGARNTIRDKKENRLYKNLEYIFLK